MRRLLVAFAFSLSIQPAHAEPSGPGPQPTIDLAALAPSPDARLSTAISSRGEVYEPDGHGAWIRRRAGELATPVVAATRAASSALALAQSGDLFRFGADEWTVVPVGVPHVKAVLGAGSRPTAASGRTVVALGATGPAKLAEAPAPVLALGAGAKTTVIETEAGLSRLERNAWQPIANAPRHVAALLSDRFALADGMRSLVDLRTGNAIAWPAATHVVVATALDDDTVLAVAAHDTAIELLTCRASACTAETIAIDTPAEAVAIVGDHGGHVVVALRDGRLAIRDHAVWTAASVRDELSPPRPGPPPAPSA